MDGVAQLAIGAHWYPAAGSGPIRALVEIAPERQGRTSLSIQPVTGELLVLDVSHAASEEIEHQLRAARRAREVMQHG